LPSSNGRTKAILVTGGRGFIGRRLVQHLVESQGRAVISADVLPAGRIDEHTRRIDIEVDIRDRDRLREVFTQFDISTVFDLASVTAVKLPRSEYVPNLEMTKSIVECVLEFDVEKYVFYSTQLVFRKEGALPASDQDYYPIDAYGESKIQSEQRIRSILPEDRWLILRPTYIWGEGHRRFRDGFLYRLAKGQLILPTAGDVLRYYGYVGTVCAQTAMLAARPLAELPSRTFYLSDEPISMRKFCAYFVSALGGARVWQVPAPFLQALGYIGDVVEAAGLTFPISKLQANEMTRSYPVPIEATLAITGTSTDYRRAAAAVVAWALSDPAFSRRIGRQLAMR
jgi:nucleoside-diphosphate-sugar epimerase